MTPDEIRVAAERVARAAVTYIGVLDVAEMIEQATSDDEIQEIYRLARTAQVTIPGGGSDA
jgi:hypothetical protein